MIFEGISFRRMFSKSPRMSVVEKLQTSHAAFGDEVKYTNLLV